MDSGQSSGYTESGQSDAETHNHRHLEDWVEPYDLADPESRGMERLYPGPRPHRLRSWRRRLFPELDAPPNVIYRDEEGRYPFSRIQKFPIVDPASRESVEARRIAERQAVFETLTRTTWKTPTDPGWSVHNPDDYPWDALENELDDCTNKDPHKGPVAKHNWERYWNHEVDRFCEQPPNEATVKAKRHRCYVCKKPHWNTRDGVELRRCLLCRNVFTCPQHWIRLACMDTFYVVVCCRHTRFTPGPGSWNPVGYYPILEGMPTIRHLQERWQDEDNIVPAKVASYDPERPEVKKRVPYRIWGDQEASSSDSETGPEYYENLARMCRVLRYQADEQKAIDDAETDEHYEALARLRLALANKPYPFRPEEVNEGHEDFVMSHDLTAIDSSKQDELMGVFSPGGPSAGEEQQSGTDLPAMSSTGQYHVTGELSPGGPSAGEKLFPDAKRLKTERLALEQEMEDVYSSDRNLIAPRERFYKTEDKCCVCQAPDFWWKPLVNGRCWFKDPCCNHRFCEEHGHTVGHYRPANMNIRWCSCHDMIALPCGVEERERSIPDSDGELPGSGYGAVVWNRDERERREMSRNRSSSTADPPLKVIRL
eukprot:6103931-Amphidinium_carterae.2